ncbi:MAG: phospholipase D-like domain-containing protein [Vitreoscilla sp.]
MPPRLHIPAGAARAWLRALASLGLALALQGCVSLAELQKTPSVAIPASADSPLAALLPADLTPGSGSAFRPLTFSSYSMDARLTLIRTARVSLDIQYYLIADDLTGRAFLRAARDAAQRGVRVRILVDDLYTAANDRLLQGIAAYPNVQVRLFNPFPAGRALTITRWGLSLADLARLNHRMHNKLFIADGVFAIAGGRNIADEYFFRSPRGNFIDFDLLVAGDAVPELAASFDRYWNSRHVYTLDALEPDAPKAEGRREEFDRATASAQMLFAPIMAGARDFLNYGPLSRDMERPPLKMLRGRIQVVADSPEKVSGESASGMDPTTVISHVSEAIAHAHENVLLASPYFVPGKVALEGLYKVRRSGVPVTLVTNTMASNDEPFVSAAYGRYRRKMLQMGVQIYEVSPRILHMDATFDDSFGAMLGTSTGRLHAKMMVVDHQTTVVGSMNLDFRSSRANTELGLFVDSAELAADVTSLVDELRSVGTYRMRLGGASGTDVQWVDDEPDGEKVFEAEPEISIATLLEVWLFSPFIEEDLL